MYKRWVSLLLCLAIVGSMIVPASAYTAHTQEQALKWAESKVGTAIDQDGAYGAQCVDLIFAYYEYLGVEVVLGNAEMFRTNKLPEGWTRIPGGKPQPGDILIWMSSELGHVGIYASDTLTYEQNWNGAQYVQAVNLPYDGPYRNYWGLIRPDFEHVHHYEKERTVKATCTQSGYTLYRCVCGASVKKDKKAALGHDYGESIVIDAPGCTEPGVRAWYCQRCGAEKTELIPATGEHHWDNGTLTSRGTCTVPGQRTYHCRSCEAAMTVDTELAPHDWAAEKQVPPTAVDDGYTVYRCRSCGRRKTSRDVTEYSDWSTRRPVPGAEEEVESRLEYRFCGLLPGQSVWRMDGSGTIDYAKFPAGFSRSHPLYKQYHVAPKSNSETDERRTSVKELGESGYLYWHWCCNTFANGPINRDVADHKTEDYSCFHAFYSETPPDGMQFITGTYNFPNRDCCRDSYWYYCLPIQRQEFTEYRKILSAGEWGDWSAWSGRRVESTPERKVEVRTVYRTAAPELMVLQSPQDTVCAPGLAASFSTVVNRQDVQYRWVISEDGRSWKSCQNGAGDTLQLDVTEDMTGAMVRCVITDSTGNEATTRAAKLRVEYCEKAPLLECSVNPVTGRPSLRWGAMKDVAHYQVYRNGQRLKEISATRMEDSAAVPGREYRYQVRAVLANGKISEWSNTDAVICTCAQPVVHITYRSDGKPVLNWQEVDGAEAYEVWRSVDGGSFTKLYTAHGTRLSNGSAQPGRTYAYRVQALCADRRGSSVPSAAVEGRCILPSPQVQLTVKAASGKPYLTWEHVEGAEKYEVWCRSGDEALHLLYTTRGDHLTHGSAEPGRTYHYQVRAVGGAFSTDVYKTCDCARPDVHLERRSGYPYLSWQTVEGAVKYEVWRSVDGGEQRLLTTVKGTHLTNNSAKRGHTYKYRVRAICANKYGNSAYSLSDTIKLS